MYYNVNEQVSLPAWLKSAGCYMVCKEQIETVGDGLLVRAPAKINLSLLVGGKRADGFHEIETVMAKIDFYDELLIQRGRKPGIELVCTGPYWAPEGKENLVYKACESLFNGHGRPANVKITLNKNVPAGKGLGPASSDAAATLIGVNEFLQLSLSRRELSKLAPALGSDVAFFLNGPLAFCSGKGEEIRELDKNFGFLVLLVLPDVSVSTRKAYEYYRPNRPVYRKLSVQINRHIKKNRIDLVSKMCANMLQDCCFSLTRGLAELKAGIESLGIGPVCLSGSGSGMFCTIDGQDRTRADEYKHKLEEKIGCRCVIVSNIRW